MKVQGKAYLRLKLGIIEVLEARMLHWDCHSASEFAMHLMSDEVRGDHTPEAVRWAVFHRWQGRHEWTDSIAGLLDSHINTALRKVFLELTQQ